MQLMHLLQGGKKPSWITPRRKRLIDQAVYAIAILAPFSYAPQTYKIYASQNADGLAISTFLILFVINAVWLLYGLAHRSRPLIITSVLFCVFHIVIISGIFMY